MARSTDLFLCFDLGGTKLAAALVTSAGKVLAHSTKNIDQSLGLDGMLADFAALGRELDPKAKYKCVSVASAGPLHAEKGLLLDPTNFFTGKKSWGVIPFVRALKRIFKKPVFLENDAAAAVLAEAWKGGHDRAKNIVVMTLGTGVGIGAVVDGHLARAGRGLHPEFSHIPINVTDTAFPCGCGAYGCIEAYLAGSHFVRHLSMKLGRDLTGEQCRDLAREGEPQALAAFTAYGRNLAVTVKSLAVVFAPEVVVLAGGFARSSPYFLPTTQKELPVVLARYREGVDLLPKIKISRLGDFAGVLGAAFVATVNMGRAK